MRPFFSQNAQLAEIIFEEGSLDVGAIDVLTEAVKEQGEDVKTIQKFDYSGDEVSTSHILAIFAGLTVLLSD